MEIVIKEIDKLIPYKNNPRKISDEAVEAIKNSIKQFEIRQPIVIDKNNVIIVGHGRLLAAKELGIKEFPCVIVDDLTDEQIKAYRIADNKTAEISGWDYSLLDQELESILNLDMGEFGFDLNTDIDLGYFFEEKQDVEKEKKLIICPHCGKPIDD